MQYLNDLNPAQKKAAQATTGPLLIVAGAGAGKTKTITHRIAHLIVEGAPPDSILAVTFTNKAAREMRERVERLLAKIPETRAPLSLYATQSGPLVTTFHSLCVRILREHAASLNLPRSFSIWDRADSVRAIKQALKDEGFGEEYEARSILGSISRAKGDAITREEYETRVRNPWERAVARVWRVYETVLAKERALDFDDLLLSALRLLNNQEIRQKLQTRWKHITIDEYQDTNRVQFELVRILAEPERNVCAVGDVDQNIYSWRGASIEHLLSFERVFPGAQVVLLEENYRSTKTIVSAAHEVISKNSQRVDKNAFTKNEDGDPLTLYHGISEEDEARYVAEKTQEYIRSGTKPEHIAVLYRANFQSRVLEDAFLQAHIPYRVLGTRFFERKEIKDVLSYIRAALNPHSSGDIARAVGAPARGIGKATLAKMLEENLDALAPAARRKTEVFYALLSDIRVQTQTQPASSVVQYVIEKSGLGTSYKTGGEDGLERLQNVTELVSLAQKYNSFPSPEGVEQLLEDAALLGEQDELERAQSAVALMTVHAAKGLEFNVVFITGLEEGLFPHERFDEHADEEEERRLFYVALTRARQKVFLSYAKTRFVYGSRAITIPSQFLGDIDPGKIVHEEPRLSVWDEPTIS